MKCREYAFGRLSLEARKYLANIGSDNVEQPASVSLSKPGTCFVPSWKDQTWTVMATERGYECDGETYRSLSAIARMITGTRWSGPRFFGLREALACKGDE